MLTILERPGHVEAIDRCPWLCAAPDGPNTPFDWPFFFFIDLIRIGMTLGAFVIIAVSMWAIKKSQVRGQKVRFVAFSATCIYMFGTEMTHLGDTPHWRFFVGLTATMLGLWGYHQHLFRELPARDRPIRQDPSP